MDANKDFLKTAAEELDRLEKVMEKEMSFGCFTIAYSAWNAWRVVWETNYNCGYRSLAVEEAKKRFNNIF